MPDEIGFLLEKEDFQQTIEGGLIGHRKGLLSCLCGIAEKFVKIADQFHPKRSVLHRGDAKSTRLHLFPKRLVVDFFLPWDTSRAFALPIFSRSISCRRYRRASSGGQQRLTRKYLKPLNQLGWSSCHSICFLKLTISSSTFLILNCLAESRVLRLSGVCGNTKTLKLFHTNRKRLYYNAL